MKTIDYTVDADGIAIITIDVKDRSMNVMTPDFIADLQEAVATLASDDTAKGAVITSAKDSFVAGADLIGLVESFDDRHSAATVYEWCRGLQLSLRKLETCGKPVAAAINGTALGGGLEICLASHYRVAADKPKAVLGLPEVQVGLMPGAGGTQRLPRLIGLEAALKLITQGSHVTPREALQAGFVDLVVTPGEEVAAARKWVAENVHNEQSWTQAWDRKGFKVPGGAGLMHAGVVQTLMIGTSLVQKMTNHNYPAPITIMSAVYEGTVLPIDKALDVESKFFVSLLMNPVSRNMMRTLFVNKGAADKLVRRPTSPAKSPVRKLGILGAGMMGAGIAYVSARAGIEVVLLDTSKEKAEFGKDYSRSLLQKAIERGKSSAEEAESLLALIETTVDYSALTGADLIIEAVFEDREIKSTVTKKAETQIESTAVFASNTSTLPISGLAEASERPDRFIGIHFFSPVDKMPLVEVIIGKDTGEDAIAKALDYIQQIRKTPIVVNDSRGFYTSRVFGVYTREGIAMLAEGVKPALIENAARHAGMPVGPLAVTDEISLELSFHVGKQTMIDLGDKYLASPADEVVRRFVEDFDRRGKRFGKGFYDYPDNGRKQLWSGLAEHYPPAAEQPAADEVRTRLLYAQAIETVRCMDEGVVTHVEDADIGSIFGWGFPPWTGGTISYIETVGLSQFVAVADRLAKTYGPRFSVPESLRKLANEGGSYYAANKPSAERSAA